MIPLAVQNNPTLDSVEAFRPTDDRLPTENIEGLRDVQACGDELPLRSKRHSNPDAFPFTTITYPTYAFTKNSRYFSRVNSVVSSQTAGTPRPTADTSMEPGSWVGCSVTAAAAGPAPALVPELEAGA
jgi:hypothetical protein